MRIAVFSDIHGNLEALTCALKQMRKERADALVCLGDIVGYGPFPNECIELVHTRCETVVRGNHDTMTQARCMALFWGNLTPTAELRWNGHVRG